MAHSPNPYQVLGVRPTASMADVQRAFRRQAFRWHPDRHPGCSESAARFRDIVAAYRAVRHSHGKTEPSNSTALEWPTWAIVPRRRHAVATKWPAKARMRVARAAGRHAVVLTLLFWAGSAMAITAIGLREPADGLPTTMSKVAREELQLLAAREAQFVPINTGTLPVPNVQQ